VGEVWETQGYKNYNGYAWYRISFNLPLALKEKALFKDSIQFLLGKIDDCDQTYLNGKLLGQNTSIVPFGKTVTLKDLSKTQTVWNSTRNYTIAANDPRLIWDKKNVLSIRVYDGSGGGGLFSLPVNIRMKDLKDFLAFDVNSKALVTKPAGILSKTIILKNLSPLPKITGTLSTEIFDLDTKQVISKQSQAVNLNKAELAFTVDFKAELSQRLRANYTFTDSGSKSTVIHTQEFPYILTPASGEKPKINGARVVGVRPGHPFLFRIPATGIRPMSF